MSVTINGTNGLTFNDASTQTTAATGFGFKNRIINGACAIDQRNAGASGTANGYTIDRFAYFGSQASKGTWQRNAGSVTPPAGFINYLGFTSSSAYTVGSTEEFEFYQSIEGLNVADLAWGTVNASTVTLSFWVRSSLTGTFGGALQNTTGNRSYPYSYTVSAANTWEQKTITVPGDTTGTWLTTNGIGIAVYFGLGVGSTKSGTAGAWSGSYLTSATGATSVVGTNGATFYITGVQLEKGSTATSFDYRPYGTELQLCQRYFYNLVAAAGAASSTTKVELYYQHPVPMRAAPTLNVVGVMRVEDVAVAAYTQSSATSTLEQASYLGMKAGFGNLTGLTSARAYFVASLASNVTASPPTGLCQVSAEL